MRRAALVLLLAVGCAGRRPPEVDVSEPPVWSTKDGRDTTRIELAAALVEADAPEAALEMVADLRKDGVAGPALDTVHATALCDIGLFDDADEVLQASLARHGRSAPLHNALGILRMDQHRLDEAVAAFEQATRHDPKNADYQNNLGFAHMSAGHHEAAILPLRTALKIDSTSRQTRNNLGFALAALGRDKEAWRVFRASGPEADAHYNLGVGRELRGDTGAAREAYASALSIDPAHQPATQALARLVPTAPEPTDAPRP